MDSLNFTLQVQHLACIRGVAMGRGYGQLTVEERVEIYRLHADGKSQRAIGKLAGRSVATISRELRRNSLATKAWGRRSLSRARAGAHRPAPPTGPTPQATASPELRATVHQGLSARPPADQGWSPHIAGRLRRAREPVISH